MLTWGNLDLSRDEIRLETCKTKRRMLLPLVKPLRPFVDALTSPRDVILPLFPSAYKAVSKTGKVGTLSNRFHSLLVEAGLVAACKHTAMGKGRDGSGSSPRSARKTLTNRRSSRKTEGDGKASIKVKLQRGGPKGSAPVMWRPAITRFDSLAPEEEASAPTIMDQFFTDESR